jgi:predicted nuclease of predicted toxin-antitoxin system
VKIRFQADADLNEVIILGVQRREPGIDFQTANEVNLRGLTDFEVLEIAARENRILESQDFKTMPAASAQLFQRQAAQEFSSCRKVWSSARRLKVC